MLKAQLEYEGAPISLEPKLLYTERKKQDRKEKGSKVTLTALVFSVCKIQLLPQQP